MDRLRAPSSLIVAALGVAGASGAALHRRGGAPTASVKNGTYQGVYSSAYDQDFFLGMPYAQPPVGALRLNNPVPLNATFSGTHNATQYSKVCPGYISSDDWPFEISEDCLTINVIRPAGTTAADRLPVATYIYGGGYFTGSSADQRYNLSFILDNSVAMGKPMIGVNFNYRVAQWGFLSSNEILQAGVANLGLKDQRLALHWIQENIEAFGGDPDKVTIWGESAGGGSVAYQSILYNGRDDGLYRAIIAESMYQASFETNKTAQNQFFNNITNATGCSTAADRLDCLRQVPFKELNQVFNNTAAAETNFFGPVIDGDLLTSLFSESFACGNFTRTPLLIGQNTDEGTSFAPKGINTTAQLSAAVAAIGPDSSGVATIEQLYPDIPADGVPVSTYPNRPPATGPDAFLGRQWKRVSAISGDYLIHAPRRNLNEQWTKYGVKSYAYRFNALPNGILDYEGVTHFTEVAFVYDNTGNYGYYEPVNAPPFANRGPRYFALASLMSHMWVSFVRFPSLWPTYLTGQINDLDPNHHGINDTANWPTYADGQVPQNFVFDANVTSHTENDTYRAAGISWINEHAVSQFHR